MVNTPNKNHDFSSSKTTDVFATDVQYTYNLKVHIIKIVPFRELDY